MATLTTLEVPIRGMDCADCTRHVQHAIAELPGVKSVEVFLSSEKAVVQLEPGQVDLPDIRKAVEGAGYAVAELQAPEAERAGRRMGRSLALLLGGLFAVVLFVVVAGEWLGLFETINEWLPWPIWLAILLAAGYPVFREVVLSAIRKQVTSHTLMTVGVIAAVAVGEWVTALVVVFFMRVGDFVEHVTTERARQAVKNLTALAPQTARVERHGIEVEIPASQVLPGEIVTIRPGEKIPVDGEVVSGQATLDQATITGESMPVEVGPGAKVYAATLASLGSLRVRTEHVGADSAFGRVIHMVEEAEGQKGRVQRMADRFSGYYLPVVAGIAALTFLISRDPLATAAVLLVACSCAIALATPIAMLASIGAGARHGLMIKGGKYLEALDKADVLLIDKTGTLTLGKPEIREIIANGELGIARGELDIANSDLGIKESERREARGEWRIRNDDLGIRGSERREASSELGIAILYYAACAERYSEHPLAEAVREAAREQGLNLEEPQEFEALPGLGVRARVDGRIVEVGNRRMLTETAMAAGDGRRWQKLLDEAQALEGEGKTLLFVGVDGEPAGLLAAADTLRPDAPQAIQELQALGLKQVELLTGDNESSAATLAGQLGVKYRAGLLPEDKIRIVREYQAQGHVVVMVGDGVNDAPALAQADVGIAMGRAGSDVAIEAAHIALLRDDWTLVPDVLRIAHRTMGVVRMNIGFTGIYNIIGLSLAAFGFLSPILAAAVQSLPDLVILGNSSRLIRQTPPRPSPAELERE
jgi:Cu+-exporting ATPase